MPRRCTIVTRVLTEEGIVGEAYNADADEEQEVIIRIVNEELAPIVTGLDAMATEACWEAMRAISFDQLRDRRFVMQAIACIDSAIWDAVGKALGMPLYKLWGGFARRGPDDRDRRLLHRRPRQRRPRCRSSPTRALSG